MLATALHLIFREKSPVSINFIRRSYLPMACCRCLQFHDDGFANFFSEKVRGCP